MDDAMQFPEPMDENSSENLADSSSGHLGNGAAGLFVGGFTGQMADSLPGSQTAEPEGTIEIEWEAEVDAFVKAEAEKAADATAADAATDQVNVGPTEAAASTESSTVNSESADVALGFESACHCFAGSIGATEEPASEDHSSQENHESETVPTEEALLQPEAEPSPILSSEAPETAVTRQSKPREDRRKRRRAMISAAVRVRGMNVTNNGPDEISTTIDVSRNGILFVAAASGYYKGMEVAVMFPYSGSPTAIHAEQCGRVVRVETLDDGRMVVALALGVGVGEDLVDACGNKLASASAGVRVVAAEAELEKPLVLAMDPEAHVRVSVKSYLESEGYKVIAVGNVVDACHVLDILQPALVVAEIEGDGLPGAGMPGYDLCVHIKETQRLKRIPVVLTTRSAYPSDYSNAHALGAIVCMAKPYKQERLGHIVRLLAPLQTHKEASTAGGRKPDPKRKACATPHAGAGRAPLLQKKYDENTNLRRKLRFPSFG